MTFLPLFIFFNHNIKKILLTFHAGFSYLSAVTTEFASVMHSTFYEVICRKEKNCMPPVTVETAIRVKKN